MPELATGGVGAGPFRPLAIAWGGGACGGCGGRLALLLESCAHVGGRKGETIGCWMAQFFAVLMPHEQLSERLRKAFPFTSLQYAEY